MLLQQPLLQSLCGVAPLCCLVAAFAAGWPGLQTDKQAMAATTPTTAAPLEPPFFVSVAVSRSSCATRHVRQNSV